MNETSCNLPFELVGPILVHCVAHSFPPLLLPSEQIALASALNALPHADIPLASYAAIRKMPHMRMEVGARIGSLHLLDLLLNMSRHPWNRPLQYNQDSVVQLAIEHGHLHVLDWWVSHGFSLGSKIIRYFQVPDFASAQVKNWCLQHGFVLYPMGKQPVSLYSQSDCRERSIKLTLGQECAFEQSAKGRLFALQWWFNDYKQTLISEKVDGTQCLIVALFCGHLDVVHWWIKSGLCKDLDQQAADEIASSEFDFTHLETALAFERCVLDACLLDMIDPIFIMACASGQLEWVEYCFGRLSIKPSDRSTLNGYSGWLYSLAAVGGHIHVLHWLDANGFPMSKLDFPTAFDLQYGHYNGDSLAAMLTWICPCGDDIEWCNCKLLDLVSKYGHVDVLNWFRGHMDAYKFSYLYTREAMNLASCEGHVQVLQWWVDSGLDPSYSGKAIKGACSSGHLNVLEWWDKSGIFRQKRKWASFGQMHEWLSSHDVFEWWLNVTEPTQKDLSKLTGALAYCDQWTIVEWFRRHYDPSILAVLATRMIKDFDKAYPELLTVYLVHQPNAIPELTEYQFLTLAKRGDTVSLQQLQKLDLIATPIYLDYLDESELYGSSYVWSIATLDWIVRSGLPMEWSSEALRKCTRLRRVHLLDWWVDSGLELKGEIDWDPLSTVWEDMENEGELFEMEVIQVTKWWEQHPNLQLVDDDI